MTDTPVLTGQTSIFDRLPPVSTTTPPSIFVPVPFSASVSRVTDPDTASEAIKRVYDNASDEWKAAASPIIHQLCRNRMEFDLDTVAEALKPIDHLPHEKRATGQLMKDSMKADWCRQTGVINSKRPSRHGGYIAVYESLIFSEPV